MQVFIKEGYCISTTNLGWLRKVARIVKIHLKFEAMLQDILQKIARGTSPV